MELRSGQGLRFVMMTADQSPELAVDHQGNRQRCAHAHIANIGDVYLCDAAEFRKGEIQLPLCTGGGDGDRLGFDVGDETDQIELEMSACRCRDVGSRIMQAEIGIVPIRLLGDHLAMQIGMKSLAHHAIETADQPHHAHGRSTAAIQRLRLSEIVDVGEIPGENFEIDRTVSDMREAIQRLLAAFLPL